MQRLVTATACLALAVACQDPTATPAPARSTTAHAPRAAAAELPVSPVRLDRSRARLPGHTADVLAIGGGRAIDPGDYVCVWTSPIFAWWDGSIADLEAREPGVFDLLYNDLAADLVALIEPALLESTATPQTFGFTGDFTKIVEKSQRDIQRFWDVPLSDVQVLGAHGRVLTDAAKVAATYEGGFGVPPADAAFFASIVSTVVGQSTVLNGGDHPLFTFNGFAIWDIGGGIPDKVILGDAFLEGYEAVGLGDVGPQGVLAHELAHHIQHRRGYPDDPYATAGSVPEQTRYLELMADAFAGYYLTHKRGAAMNRKRVEQFLEAFFEIGDCAFDDPGHHGTPNQRMAASRFGFDVADEAQKQGQILTADQFHARFVARYPTLIAPDAH